MVSALVYSNNSRPIDLVLPRLKTFANQIHKESRETGTPFIVGVLGVYTWTYSELVHVRLLSSPPSPLLKLILKLFLIDLSLCPQLLCQGYPSSVSLSSVGCYTWYDLWSGNLLSRSTQIRAVTLRFHTSDSSLEKAGSCHWLVMSRKWHHFRS